MLPRRTRHAHLTLPLGIKLQIAEECVIFRRKRVEATKFRREGGPWIRICKERLLRVPCNFKRAGGEVEFGKIREGLRLRGMGGIDVRLTDAQKGRMQHTTPLEMSSVSVVAQPGRLLLRLCRDYRG